MDRILSDFIASCSALLKDSPGPEGRAKVADLLSDLLADPANIETFVPPSTGERDLLYEDAELGFCVFAHVYDSAKHPHRMTTARHGPSMRRRAAKPK